MATQSADHAPQDEGCGSSLARLNVLDLPDEALLHVFGFVNMVPEKNSAVSKFISKPNSVEGPSSDEPSDSRKCPATCRCSKCHHTPRGDIKACRLTCRRFNALSSEFLLEAVTVDMLPESLAIFEGVTRHAAIRRRVTTVDAALRYYTDSVLDDEMAFVAFHRITIAHAFTSFWNDVIHNWSHTPSKRSENFKKQFGPMIQFWWRLLSEGGVAPSVVEDRMHFDTLRSAHQEYRRLCLQQLDMEKGDRFLHAVAEGIARMPYAKRLRFVPGEPRPDSDLLPVLHEHEDVRVPFKEHLAKPENIHQALTTHPSSPVRIPLCDVVTRLPIAVHQAGVLLEQIDVVFTYIEAHAALLPGPEMREQLRAALQSLRRFSVWPEMLEMWDHPPQVHEGVGDILAPFLAAPGLEELDLAFDEMGRDASLKFDMTSILPSLAWQSLSTLRLCNVSFDLSSLRCFRNRPRGKSLDLLLGAPYLRSGTWAEALDILREAALGWFRIFDILGGGIGFGDYRIPDRPFPSWEVHQYVLGTTDYNPLRES